MSFFGGRRQQPELAASEQVAEQRSAPQPVGFETVLGVNAVLSGDLHSAANVRLDGAFKGTLEIEGNVLIGETAQIEADVNARNISTAGAVRGNVNGSKVQILRTGRVWGDISARSITTEEGAFIDGRITMVEHDASWENAGPRALPDSEASATVPELAAPEDEIEAGQIMDDEVPEGALDALDVDTPLEDLPRDEEGAFG